MVREILARLLWTVAVRVRSERFSEGGNEAEKMSHAFSLAKGEVSDMVERIDADEASWEWDKAEGEKKDDGPRGMKRDAEGKKKDPSAAAKAAALAWVKKKKAQNSATRRALAASVTQAALERARLERGAVEEVSQTLAEVHDTKCKLVSALGDDVEGWLKGCEENLLRDIERIEQELRRLQGFQLRALRELEVAVGVGVATPGLRSVAQCDQPEGDKASAWADAGSSESSAEAEMNNADDPPPLQTKIVSREQVRKEPGRWRRSVAEEYESLVKKTEAVEEITDAQFQEMIADSEISIELIPGKMVYVRKTSGRRQTRIVGCGNFCQQDGEGQRAHLYARGAGAESLRMLITRAALEPALNNVSVDVKTAFLQAPLLEMRYHLRRKVTVVRVPSILAETGITSCKYWKVKKALYGLASAKKSWSSHGDAVLGNSALKLKKMPEDANLWHIVETPGVEGNTQDLNRGQKDPPMSAYEMRQKEARAGLNQLGLSSFPRDEKGGWGWCVQGRPPIELSALKKSLSAADVRSELGADVGVSTEEARTQIEEEGKGRLVASSGRVLDAAAVIRHTGLRDGDSMILHVNPIQLQSSRGAFAAILGDGSVVTWGLPSYGGDSSAVQEQLKNVQKIQATDRAFAAVLGDGSVVTWGDADFGGDSRAAQDKLKNVQQIHGTAAAFAALSGDGCVVTWGDVDFGGDSSAVQHQLKSVKQIQGTYTAFAAILGDGSVVTWGIKNYGGDSTAVQDQLRNAQQIQATYTCNSFAAILGDGSVVTWGDSAYGGDSSAVQDQLKNVQQIQANDRAFAAILDDGSVVTWGGARQGGDSIDVQDQLKNVQQIQASRTAFAAILGDGSVVTWGEPCSGTPSRSVQGQLKNVQHLKATDRAFAAILGNGSVVTWGPAGCGGDSTAVQDQLKNVQKIQATERAFAANLGDGSVVTWGDADYGGDSTIVQGTVGPAPSRLRISGVACPGPAESKGVTKESPQ
ncbi:putative E3 ubiquitin-protein ligase HERC1 [Symbiodinium microadriaticum]|uniref:Putative E3 ubiquitin-protein ligase HERC1 n=1 Tax=Symbiodinium microadriaticum TaxID=2951 RepID=A0A1Q9F4W3_SYMMI|nr:putative E3 ubiquitin-protein ligase HERC1 [Symbiodinium microadriaticum]